jgi:uncharacterized membrane protein
MFAFAIWLSLIPWLVAVIWEVNATLPLYLFLLFLLFGCVAQAVTTYDRIRRPTPAPDEDELGSLSPRAVAMQMVLFTALAVVWPFRLPL